jgi:hypothetical protein
MKNHMDNKENYRIIDMLFVTALIGALDISIVGPAILAGFFLKSRTKELLTTSGFQQR